MRLKRILFWSVLFYVSMYVLRKTILSRHERFLLKRFSVKKKKLPIYLFLTEKPKQLELYFKTLKRT